MMGICWKREKIGTPEDGQIYTRLEGQITTQHGLPRLGWHQPDTLQLSNHFLSLLSGCLCLWMQSLPVCPPEPSSGNLSKDEAALFCLWLALSLIISTGFHCFKRLVSSRASVGRTKGKSPSPFICLCHPFKGIAWHFGKPAYLLSCWELDKHIDITLESVMLSMKLPPAAG